MFFCDFHLHRAQALCYHWKRHVGGVPLSRLFPSFMIVVNCRLFLREDQTLSEKALQYDILPEHFHGHSPIDKTYLVTHTSYYVLLVYQRTPG